MAYYLAASVFLLLDNLQSSVSNIRPNTDIDQIGRDANHVYVRTFQQTSP